MSVATLIDELEAAGAMISATDEEVRVRYASEEHRRELAGRVALLRASKDEVLSVLRARRGVPTMPPGVQLVEWRLKEPPIAIETCAIVTDPFLFASTTLEQLRIKLENPKRWVGWTVPQLIDRLAQVGVTVALESRGARATHGA